MDIFGLNFETLQHLLFYWIVPFAVVLGLVFLFIQFGHEIYARWDLDRIWRVGIKYAIITGAIVGVWVFLTHSETVKELLGFAGTGKDWILTTEQGQQGQQAVQNLSSQGLAWYQKVVIFLMKWAPVYFRAVVVVGVISLGVLIRALLWRIAFTRAMNICVVTVLAYPYLILKYFAGYQSPVFDFVQTRLYRAKIKENLNDSYFEALHGYDDRGQRFENGAGGTVQTQKIKAVALIVRQSKVNVKTANGIRHAEIQIRDSRETDTDKMLEQILKGFGTKHSAPSIRFQENPVYRDKWFVFDSDVPFSAGDTLGSWRSIFVNPFAKSNRIANGGEGAVRVFLGVIQGIFDYFRHLTPSAFYDQMVDRANRMYTPDKSGENAKYIAKRNLDLSVIPVPVDPETGNDIHAQKKLAEKKARERIEDVQNAISAFKINATFDNVQVGGNNAVYTFLLAREANLPTDFNKVAEGMSRMLKTNNIPIITTKAGVLEISVVNGVNIPTDFRAMVENRPTGMKALLSGIAGVDALGKNIYVELGDKNPHIILFGKTGTGKTVLLMNIIYSIMDGANPDEVKIAYIDGKGNSFEFMRTDNNSADNYHPNPYTYAQPADASGDIDYARALIKHIEKETRRRIAMFKERGISKIDNWNKRYPDEKLFEILFVVDEFSAILDQDKTLKASELAEKGVSDVFEYIAKMARSVGIRMILANQTARKEKLKGTITANITGRVSLGVSEPIESEIAMPDSKIALHYISQAGEFYSTLNGVANVEHGNSPYLDDDTLYALNDGLEKKFGHQEYIISREEILSEYAGEDGDEGGVSSVLYDVPSPLPTQETAIDELIGMIKAYPNWANANRSNAVFANNVNLLNMAPSERNRTKKKIAEALIEASKFAEKETPKTRKASGQFVA